MSNLKQRLITGIFFLIVFFSAFFIGQPHLFKYFIYIIVAQSILEFRHLVNWQPTKFAIISFFYPISPFIFILLMNNETYHNVLFKLFILIFSFDIGSYILGNLLGKHKISTLSPKKTWEGVIGGLIFVMASLFTLQRIGLQNLLSPWQLILLSLAFSILALAGDLLESWFKRKSKRKDSGNILPGHGGILDRFDSFTFTAPLFYFLRNWL